MEGGLLRTHSLNRRLINFIDTTAKCRHLKKLTRKGTLRFIRVYRLEIQSVMLVFSTQLCELLPLSPSLWFNSLLPCPPSQVNKYTVYMHTVWKNGGGGMIWCSEPYTDKNLQQSPFTGKFFFRWRNFAMPSMSLIFLLNTPPPRISRLLFPPRASKNQRLFDICDKEFIDWHCQS